MTSESVAARLASRQSAIDGVLADPPVVHYLTYEDLQAQKLTGVHSTDESCYRFLATVCDAGSRTLETGSGISTVLFGAWGCLHRCVTPAKEERDAILDYCSRHSISTEDIVFDVRPSADALTAPEPDLGPLDLVFIDGNHGFPHPMIDWFYGVRRLRQGGVLVVDDIDLPAVTLLAQFLDSDTRWRRLHRTGKWAAYERNAEWSLLEDWYQQPDFRVRGSRSGPLGPLEDRLRPPLRRLKRSITRRRRRSPKNGSFRPKVP